MVLFAVIAVAATDDRSKIDTADDPTTTTDDGARDDHHDGTTSSPWRSRGRPPGSVVGHIERSDSHAYDSPGERPIVVTIASGDYDGTAHPSSSYVELELTVAVHS